jgi:citrate synthase
MSGTVTPHPPGLDGVVAARTRLSHVDGLAGQLIIGGYELKEIAGRVSFEEAAFLLWRGTLPGKEELGLLRAEMAAMRRVPPETMSVVRAAAKAPPIDALRMACATLSLDVANPEDISLPADISTAKMLTARFPTIIAAHARIAAGEQTIAPREDLSLAANFCIWSTAESPIRSRPRPSTPTGSP